MTSTQFSSSEATVPGPGLSHHSFRRKLIGLVVSDKMDKTIVVEVNRYSRDSVYKKYVKRRVKYKAHDEKNDCKTGDRVEIQEDRPYSKQKRFRVVRTINRVIAELDRGIR